MPAPIPASDPSDLPPLAVRDDQVARLILGHDIFPGTRDRLRARGDWPPAFYVAGRAYVLRSDIDAFLARAKEATDEKRRLRQIHGRNAVEARWARHRQVTETDAASQPRTKDDLAAEARVRTGARA